MTATAIALLPMSIPTIFLILFIRYVYIRDRKEYLRLINNHAEIILKLTEALDSVPAAELDKRVSLLEQNQVILERDIEYLRDTQ